MLKPKRKLYKLDDKDNEDDNKERFNVSKNGLNIRNAQ